VKTKELIIQGLKAVGGGLEVTPGMLEKINRYALSPMTAEKVYVRKFMVANSGVDRDNERFPKGVLEDFAHSLPGKGYFNNDGGHPGGFGGQRGAGQGLWFDAYVEDMPLDRFAELTGSRPKLAPGEDGISALTALMYMPVHPDNELMRLNLDAGIHRFVSIGFRAADLSPVYDECDNRALLYWEYQAPGEALEASSVYLGAQHGAVVVKSFGAGIHMRTEMVNITEGGQEDMDKEDVKELEEYRLKVPAMQGLITDLKALGIGSVEDAKAMLARAADGDAYRKDLSERLSLRLTQLKRLPEEPEKKEARMKLYSAWPIAELKAAVEDAETEVRKLLPDAAELPGEVGKREPEGGKKNRFLYVR
jgi:hypothetical protein